ncbi:MULTISPECIES: VOC family protein [Dyella]|uniref:VOC family protein n=2 Tax=Dyella TaxID=231454 RepID=A0A4R0Z510_9GAMM|nr:MULTISPECIES: VOC family protein [Dyella]TBR38939.1 VOC family protein [Dyella terrae]TCI13470.1 VOC family protein [Dyella soli]
MSQSPSYTVHEAFPYLRVRDAARALSYYQRAFGARLRFQLIEPGTGRIGHAELELGPAVIMVSDEYPECDIVGPQSIGGTSVSIHLHVDDADAMLARAVEAGGTLVRPAADAFYGERGGTVRDPFGHEWLIGHSIEQVSPEEMQRRYDALMAGS